MRECSKCHEEKPDAEFVWDDGRLLGFAKRCKLCRATSVRVLPPWHIHPRYRIQRHAIARFHERVRPDLAGYTATVQEMIRMMADAELTDEPPAWYGVRQGQHGRGYLLVAPGVIFCLADYRGRGVRVSTVLVEEGYPTPPAVDAPRWITAIAEERVRRISANRMRAAARALQKRTA